MTVYKQLMSNKLLFFGHFLSFLVFKTTLRSFRFKVTLLNLRTFFVFLYFLYTFWSCAVWMNVWMARMKDMWYMYVIKKLYINKIKTQKNVRRLSRATWKRKEFPYLPKLRVVLNTRNDMKCPKNNHLLN
jgi:hypothetical protein